MFLFLSKTAMLGNVWRVHPKNMDFGFNFRDQFLGSILPPHVINKAVAVIFMKMPIFE